MAQFALGQRAVRVIQFVEHANVFGVVSDGEEVKRFAAAHLFAEIVDLVAASELIGLFRRRLGAHKHIGVERVGGVQVEIAVIGLTVFGCAGGSGRRGRGSGGDALLAGDGEGCAGDDHAGQDGTQDVARGDGGEQMLFHGGFLF